MSSSRKTTRSQPSISLSISARLRLSTTSVRRLKIVSASSRVTSPVPEAREQGRLGHVDRDQVDRLARIIRGYVGIGPLPAVQGD